ncbi:MAG: radical SAM protein, partial [Conexivisphaera sp.]
EPIWGRSLLVESSRGCSRLCRFCMEGNVYFPAIHRPLDQILQIVERGLPANDVERVTFYSLSFFDHPDADSILRAVSELGAQASLPSIRMDTLNADRLRTMSDLGQRTLTVAPESGACRLRRALGKPWPEEELLSIASTAADVGIEVLKLYYMLGLPGENPDSAEAIAREVLHVKRAAHLRISVSVTPFMPKPHTPLQWAGMEDEDVLTRKIHALTSALRAEGIKVDFYSPRLARIQTAIARGGPEITCPLEEKARGLTWGRAFSACGIDVDARASRLDLDEEVPWSIVDLPRPMDALRRAADTYWMELEGSDGNCA